MALFGRDVWLSRGEAFALAFGVFARFAPLAVGKPEEPASASMTAFVLFLLASVLFDGALATPAWARDRKSTRLNSSHQIISYAVFCLKKKKNHTNHRHRT